LFTNQLKEYGLTFIVDVIEFGGGGLWKLTQTELGDSTLQKNNQERAGKSSWSRTFLLNPNSYSLINTN
jgi:hypothetical protein